MAIVLTEIVRGSPDDTYALLDSKVLRGGAHIVPTYAELPAGTFDNLDCRAGRLYYALDTKKFYRYNSDNRTYPEVQVTGSSDDLTKIEADILALQNQDVKTIAKDSAQDAYLSVLRSDITQKISGIHVEDVDNNAFDDIKAIHFMGATVSDDGSQQATVTVNPKFAIAKNGSQTTHNVNALVFSGDHVNVSVKPEDNNVGVISVGSGSGSNPDNTVNISNGVDTISGVSTLTFPNTDLTGSASVDTKYNFRHFTSIAARDSWSTKYSATLTDEVVVVDNDGNGFVGYFQWNSKDSKWKDYNAQGVVMSDAEGAIPKLIKTAVFGSGFTITQAGDREDAALITYTESGGGSGDGSITLDDGVTNVAGINTINLKGALITKTPISPDGDVGVAEVTTGMNITNYNGVGSPSVTTKMVVMHPLQAYPDPEQTGDESVRLGLTHGVFEPLHAPSFLAYIKDSTDIVGKLPQGLEFEDGDRHKGALWFEDIVVPEGSYIELDKNNKAYGIQEADDLDPNFSGGTDYLIAYRIHMRGNAPSDGLVRIYLYDHDVNPNAQKGYLLDKLGKPMMVQRKYKANEELGVLDVIGVVNAKGSQKFQAIVEDTFQGDLVELTDRTEGCTGLMIQALRTNDKTGRGLIQFEQDTHQNIEFSSHYLGVDRMSITYVNSIPDPIKDYAPKENFYTVDGLELINRSGIKSGSVDGKMVIQDNGIAMADYNFGKVFTSEETHMLRGKVVTVSTTSTSKKSASRVFAVSWTGKPDEYTSGIISSWSNSAPVFEAQWAKFGEFEITKNVSAEDVVSTHDFVIPDTANNYAIIVAPNSGDVIPYELILKQFKVDVKEPFTGYSLHAPENLNETHFTYDKEYKDFTQNTQGYAGLRYTIGNVPEEGLPMPIGIEGVGLADVSLNPAFNIVSGSGAKGGEGVLDFKSDGSANISVMLKVSNETTTNSKVDFWFSSFDGNGDMTKIVDSVFSIEVPPNTDGILYKMVYAADFNAGTMIGLRASSNKTDGAYLSCTSDKSPMVKTILNYKKIEAIDTGDDPWIGTDFSGFDSTHSNIIVASKDFKNSKTGVINFTIPDGGGIAYVNALLIKGGSIKHLTGFDYHYDGAKFNLSFGASSDVRVIIGAYA